MVEVYDRQKCQEAVDGVMGGFRWETARLPEFDELSPDLSPENFWVIVHDMLEVIAAGGDDDAKKEEDQEHV